MKIVFDDKTNPYFLKNGDYFLQLLRLVEKFPKHFGRMLRAKNGKYQYLVDWLNQVIPTLEDSKYNFATRLYWLFNGITNFPKCANENCNNIIGLDSNVNDIKFGYHRYCCPKCAQTSNEVKKSHIESSFKKFGTAHPMQNQKTILKRSNTIEKILKSDPLYYKKRNKKRECTCLKLYGVSSNLLLDTPKLNSKKTILEKSYNNYIVNNKYDEPLFSLEEYCNRKNFLEPLHFRCRKCNREFVAIHDNGFHKRCPYCYPTHGTSDEEQEVFSFLNSLLAETSIVKNKKTIIPPLELDIYIESRKLAIEFDGLYWHSTENKNKPSYHLLKTNKCEEKEIQLIHIFENEWVYKKDIVKSRLKNLLGIYDSIIFARKCEVKEVEAKTSNAFQDKNHLQGHVNSKVNLGLYYQNDLIALMTFGKPRFDKKHDWELLRFCNKLGYHIPGAASKLLKHFERSWHPKSIISYADRRWSRGKLYEALGFKLDHASGPNYWYFNKQSLELYSRVKFQKHKLKNLLVNFDEKKTEVENMNANGFRRIFDCGNLVFVKKY